MAKLKRWGRELLLLALIALAVVTVMDWLNAPQAPPAFDAQTLTTLDGESVSLAQLSHERPLLVYFWASWCGVCRFTTPDVARLQAAGGNVLTVALRSGDDAQVKQWLARKRLALPVVNDPAGTLGAVADWRDADLRGGLAGQGGADHHRLDQLLGMKLRLWWAAV